MRPSAITRVHGTLLAALLLFALSSCQTFRQPHLFDRTPDAAEIQPPPLPQTGRAGVLGDERELPNVDREFRGLWVATVANIDWPSQPGLPVARQQEELIEIMDQAARLHFNAIVFQIRPSCDALYESEIEPWSEYLTGQQGSAPAQNFDPLAFAIKQAHARGMELHAWFNPFRVRAKDARSPVAARHIARTKPALVRDYGDQQWLDPGMPEARQHSLRVVEDVVRRYAVDGVHIDDYFYPYPIKGENGKSLPFPDDGSYQQYRDGGGPMARDDWRRANINEFVSNLYEVVHRTRPQAKVGISPFGIWRPGHPESVRGLDAYQTLYADARLWLAEGWCDYLSPQLYWKTDAKNQGFAALLGWWQGQNARGRHIWPGCNLNSVGDKWPTSEVLEQIRTTRRLRGGGVVFFSAKALAKNRGGLSDLLLSDGFVAPALVPETPWLDARRPAPPEVRLVETREGAEIAWRPRESRETPRRWVIRTRSGGEWRVAIVPGIQYRFVVSRGVDGRLPELIAVSAVDASGNLSAPILLR